jgi:hypothetical protein
MGIKIQEPFEQSGKRDREFLVVFVRTMTSIVVLHGLRLGETKICGFFASACGGLLLSAEILEANSISPLVFSRLSVEFFAVVF